MFRNCFHGGLTGCLFDQLLHPFIVRPLPVDLLASRADLKFIEIQLCQWFQPVEHGLFIDRLEWVVAAQAAMEGDNPVCQLEATDDLNQLLRRLEGTQTVAIGYDLAHEQAPVPAEKDPFLPLDSRRQFFVSVVVLIQAIESEHPQIGSQAPEMTIQDKAGLNGTAIRHGEQLHPVAIPGDVSECPHLTVDLHGSDLRVRHAKRLCQMFDRLPAAKIYVDGLLSLVSWKEIVQPADEHEMSAAHGKNYIPLPASLHNIRDFSPLNQLRGAVMWRDYG